MDIFQGALTLGMAIGGWFAKMLHTKIEKNAEDLIAHKKDFAEHKFYVAENYVKNVDIQVMRDEIKYVRDGVDDIKQMLINGKGKK